MKNNEKPSYHHGNLKDALIVETLNMVEENGVENITLRELTKRLGTSRSAIYRHFDSKDTLIKAVILSGFEKLENAIASILLQETDILDRFYNMGKAYLHFAVQNPNIYRMMFGHKVEKQREESCDINDKESPIGFHALVSLLAEGQEKNILKKEDPMLQATYVWANIHGLSNLCIDGHLHVSDNIETLFELSFNSLVRGMRL